MKLNVAFTRSLLMAASIGMVVPVIAQTSPKAAPDKAKPPTKSSAAKPAKAPEVDAPPEPTIAGLAIPREQGGFLGLAVEESRIQLRFYDNKKKLLAPDVTRATLKWTSTKKKGEEHVVLNLSGEGKSLTSDRIIPPPYNFRVVIRLLQADETANAESYTVQLSQ